MRAAEGKSSRHAWRAWGSRAGDLEIGLVWSYFTVSVEGGAVLRLSKLTDYGIVVLARMGEAEAEDGPQSAPGLALRTALPEPTVAKVLKILSQAGLAEGLRGARGGYRLARPLGAIPLSEVIVAFEGPIALTACVDGASGGCESEELCPVRGRWDPVNRAIRGALERITVAELAGQPPGASLAPPRHNLSLAAE